ncbi:hypothetical protein [uncultured Brevibacillus sp.]|uniref:hypothetical protein n=1 Tax=uncultured Brevibacillus sp. TaxID=169970 RepID=UPI002599E106|nr:hypothetical protein [uncultured Brevibacillus sp.]
MRKLFLATVSICLMLVSLVLPASAATNYPGTTVNVSTGDLIYSSKGWSSYFAGHVAIIGDDGKVYHSTPAVSSGGIGETLDSYLSRYPSGEYFEVLRFEKKTPGPYLEPINAGKWARNNVSKIQSYTIAGGYKLGDITKNYCSKFMWQAYYFGAGTNIDRPYLGNYMTPDSTTLWAPSEIMPGGKFTIATGFKKP